MILQKEIRILFNNIENQQYDIMHSSVTEEELLNAPEQVKDLLNSIPKILLKESIYRRRLLNLPTPIFQKE